MPAAPSQAEVREERFAALGYEPVSEEQRARNLGFTHFGIPHTEAPMPDVAPQHPLTPGKHTSEHRLTTAVLLIGLGMEALSAFLQQLGGAGVGAGTRWYPIVLACLGGTSQVVSLLGYQRSRALVKVAALAGETDDAS